MINKNQFKFNPRQRRQFLDRIFTTCAKVGIKTPKILARETRLL